MPRCLVCTSAKDAALPGPLSCSPWGGWPHTGWEPSCCTHCHWGSSTWRGQQCLLLWLTKFGELTQGRHTAWDAVGKRAGNTCLGGGSSCPGGSSKDCSPWCSAGQRSSKWHGSAERICCALTPASCVTCHFTQGTGEQHAVNVRGKGEKRHWTEAEPGGARGKVFP